MIDIKMSTVVLLLNQDGITELIQIANDLQNKVDSIMSSGQKTKDRMADAGAATSFLEAAKEKLPMILEEEGDDEETKTASSLSTTASSESKIYLSKFFMSFLLRNGKTFSRTIEY